MFIKVTNYTIENESAISFPVIINTEAIVCMYKGNNINAFTRSRVPGLYEDKYIIRVNDDATHFESRIVVDRQDAERIFKIIGVSL